MATKSTYRIRFDGTTYLSNGDYMEDEISIDSGQSVEVTPLIRGDAPKIEGRGNLVVTYGWTRVELFATVELARIAQHSRCINLPTAKKTAIIEMYDSTPSVAHTVTYTLGQFTGAVMENANARMIGPTQVVTAYSMICTGAVIT